MKILRAVLFLSLLTAAFFGGYAYKSWSRPGAGTAPQKAERKVLYWVDPMHPAYTSDKPGIAPDCGMKLVPVYEGSSPPSHPAGTVQVDAEKQQLIGVRFGQAEMTSGSQTIRAVGQVAYDETRIAHVHTKFEGYVDKVYVDFTGQIVKQGQPLLTIYSPELLATQRELLLAAKAKAVMKKSTLASAISQSESLLVAARRRLELWDISDAQVQQVLDTGQPIKNLTLYAPIGGYVLERKAFPNARVVPDTDLFTLVDMSKVWIIADVFESEASMVRVGQAARVTFSYGPSKSFSARVNYIQPQVDPTTRTLKVRLDADNSGMTLKPEMYVNVTLQADLPAVLSVPAEAVLDSGDRKTVFVDRGNGYFEPRQVETGDRAGGRIAIVRGLKAGERIVISGNFLLDSESQLKSAAAGGAHQHD